MEAVHRQPVLGATGGLLAHGLGRALRLGDDAVASGFGRVLVGIVVEHRLEAGAHLPFDVVGEHAQEDVGADAVGEPMVDRPDLEIDGLQAAEGALDEPATCRRAPSGIIEGVGGQAGADHVDAVERRLGGDRVRLAGEAEAGRR